jgi:hypothetical protein
VTNNDDTKELIHSLPEDVQDSIASVALSQLKGRTRLERRAAGSGMSRAWWISPIFFGLAILVVPVSPDSFPVIAGGLVSVILVGIGELHGRIDAIYRLMKDDYDALAARIEPAEQNVAPKRSEAAATLKSTPPVRSLED